MPREDPEFNLLVYTVLCLEKNLLNKKATKKYQSAIEENLKGTLTYNWLMVHVDNYKSINPSNRHLKTKQKYWENIVIERQQKRC
tara:strand:+ start:2727 stop:2981 length:255 start_codon:yes stop_codon:yes gene_type:complete